MAMIAKIEGGRLIVAIDLAPKGTRSKSGKTETVASSYGNQTVTVQGYDKPVTIGLNAYTK